MQLQAADEFFRRLAAERPEPRTELHYANTYTLLVAVVLSAQATDAGVNKATKKLFERVKTPQAMLALGEAGLKQHIRTIGLYNAKARNIMALSKILAERFGGEVPRNREDLESLPGVGRKTANVLLNSVFGENVIAVDTHVFRVGNRTGLARGATPEVVERRLMKAVPHKWLTHAHHWLILHGRYVCKARRPECWHCLVSDLCAFKEKTPAPPNKNGGL
ncbi:MAG: endonuclease III [Bdellovibrionales bacterium]